MFTLDRVVPWGRSFDEYRRMFALSDRDLARTMLGCGDGPASFNAEATALGARVVSCDPVYVFSQAQIEERVRATYETVLDQARRNTHEFVWGAGISTVEELGRVRLEAMCRFLDDFEGGRGEGRYVAARLPELPFRTGAFDLALCSHLLFLYSDQLGEPFHLAAVQELCRTAAEVRIFPLLELGGRRSPFVEACLRGIRDLGYRASIERVPYEFQRGGNEMLRIRCREGA